VYVRRESLSVAPPVDWVNARDKAEHYELEVSYRE
jgi:hypothetical protein